MERRSTWLCKCYASLSITAMYTVQFTTLVPCENSKVVESSYTDVVIAMNEECSIMRHQSNNLGLGSMILYPTWLQVQILIVECLVLKVLKGSYSWVNYSWMNCISEVLVNLGTSDSWRENCSPRLDYCFVALQVKTKDFSVFLMPAGMLGTVMALWDVIPSFPTLAGERALTLHFFSHTWVPI